MTERVLGGSAASPGIALGRAHVLDAPAAKPARDLGRDERLV